MRSELVGDEIDAITIVETLTGEVLQKRDQMALFPAKAYVTGDEQVEAACQGILEELQHRLLDLQENNKLVEAHRLEKRTRYDVEMIREMGFCPGIENYTGCMDGREAGSRPWTLMDYFP